MKIEQFVGRSLIFAIGSGYDTIWRDFNARLRKERCNFLQSMILISLVFEEEIREPATPSRLADALRTSRANISHCVSFLEGRKLLRRSLNSGDARSYELVLTPEGRKTAHRFIRVINELENYFEKRFGREEVLATVQRIAGFEAAYRERR